jgi:hypothetical protein
MWLGFGAAHKVPHTLSAPKLQAAFPTTAVWLLDNIDVFELRIA